GGRIMKCEKCNVILDRDATAVLNLQMRGEGFPQRAPNELIEGGRAMYVYKRLRSSEPPQKEGGRVIAQAPLGI
ncbi:MAG: hypothetical protein QXK32_11100, partial [Candidatus Jordarchaeales archaeon]